MSWLFPEHSMKWIRDRIGYRMSASMVKIRGRLTMPWTRRRCCSGSMSGTPLWCRSKCSPLGGDRPLQHLQRRPGGPTAGRAGLGANERARDLALILRRSAIRSERGARVLHQRRRLRGTGRPCRAWSPRSEAADGAQRREATAQEDPSIEQSIRGGRLNSGRSRRRPLWPSHIPSCSLLSESALASTDLESTGPTPGCTSPWEQRRWRQSRRGSEGCQAYGLCPLRCSATIAQLLLRSSSPSEPQMSRDVRQERRFSIDSASLSHLTSAPFLLLRPSRSHGGGRPVMTCTREVRFRQPRPAAHLA
jgi:hypothetical protein